MWTNWPILEADAPMPAGEILAASTVSVQTVVAPIQLQVVRTGLQVHLSGLISRVSRQHLQSWRIDEIRFPII